MSIYLAMEAVNNVLDGIFFRLEDRGRTHFVPCVPELCLADQTAILRLVDDVIKDRAAPDSESALPFLRSGDPGLLDGIDRIFAFNVVHRVADGVILELLIEISSIHILL